MFPVVETAYKLRPKFGLKKRHKLTSSHTRLTCLTLPRSLSLSSTMGFTLFLEVLYTLGIFSNRDSAQCVNILALSPCLLFSGVIGKKG